MTFGVASAQQTNPLLQHEAEITEIIKTMTLEEKVNMLHGKTMFSSAGIERLGIADMKYADGPFGIREELEDSPAYALGIYPQQEQGGGDVFVNLVNRDRFAVRKADADYSEGIFVGFRWYTTKNVKPIYAFGYGLSYVPFKYSNLAAKVEGENIEVSFDLANQGNMEAEEVSQVYIGRPGSKVERPKYELKGFKRTAIKAGETTKITITIPKDRLRHWNEFQHAWNVESGKAVIYVGSSSDNLPLQTTVEI